MLAGREFGHYAMIGVLNEHIPGHVYYAANTVFTRIMMLPCIHGNESDTTQHDYSAPVLLKGM